jgi:hypothetical protein
MSPRLKQNYAFLTFHNKLYLSNNFNSFQTDLHIYLMKKVLSPLNPTSNICQVSTHNKIFFIIQNQAQPSNIQLKIWKISDHKTIKGARTKSTKTNKKCKETKKISGNEATYNNIHIYWAMHRIFKFLLESHIAFLFSFPF